MRDGQVQQGRSAMLNKMPPFVLAPALEDDLHFKIGSVRNKKKSTALHQTHRHTLHHVLAKIPNTS